MKKISFFVVAFALSACATTTELQWAHPTNSERQLAADRAICRAFAVKEIPLSPGSYRLITEGERDDILSGCMHQKGYYLQKSKH